MTSRQNVSLVPPWSHAVCLGMACGAIACGRPVSPEPGSEWVDHHRFSYLEPVGQESDVANEQLPDQLAYLQSLRGGRPVRPELDAETCQQICGMPSDYDDDRTHLESCQYATVGPPSPKARRVVVCNGYIEEHWQLPVIK